MYSIREWQLPPVITWSPQVRGETDPMNRGSAYPQSDEKSPCPPGGRLISINKRGRLGNVMFMYAFLLAVSDALRWDAWLLPDMAETLSLYFETPSTPVLPRDCRYNWTEFYKETILHQVPIGNQDILITGYPTTLPAFHHLRKQVLREFTFRSELRARADHRLAELASQSNITSPTFIGVHVRRTDYKKWLKRYVKGKMIKADYLNRALSLMRRRHPGALFVVSSDDLEWCRRELRGPDVVLAGDGVQTQPGGDMALLAACNHTVLTYGTYGFWSAYLAGGEVVAATGYGTKPAHVEYQVRNANLTNWTFIDAFTEGESSKTANVSGKRM